MGAIQSGVNSILGSVAGGISTATDLSLKKKANEALKGQLAKVKSDLALKDLQYKNEQLIYYIHILNMVLCCQQPQHL